MEGAARFSSALQTLLGKQYSCEDTADKAMLKFMNEAQSVMHKKRSSKGDKTTTYRCGVDRKCPFQLQKSLTSEGIYLFECSKPSHVGHDLAVPRRATSLATRITKQVIGCVQMEGRDGLDMTNAVVNRAQEIGFSISAKAVNLMKRDLSQRGKAHISIVAEVRNEWVI